MRISDWSSDVCSSDLIYEFPDAEIKDARIDAKHEFGFVLCERHLFNRRQAKIVTKFGANRPDEMFLHERIPRSEEHTSELQSLMRISYAVFCLKKKTKKILTKKTTVYTMTQITILQHIILTIHKNYYTTLTHQAYTIQQLTTHVTPH